MTRKVRAGSISASSAHFLSVRLPWQAYGYGNYCDYLRGFISDSHILGMLLYTHYPVPLSSCITYNLRLSWGKCPCWSWTLWSWHHLVQPWPSSARQIPVLPLIGTSSSSTHKEYILNSKSRFSQDLMLVDNELLGIVDFVECETSKPLIIEIC